MNENPELERWILKIGNKSLDEDSIIWIETITELIKSDNVKESLKLCWSSDVKMLY